MFRYLINRRDRPSARLLDSILNIRSAFKAMPVSDSNDVNFPINGHFLGGDPDVSSDANGKHYCRLEPRRLKFVPSAR